MRRTLLHLAIGFALALGAAAPAASAQESDDPCCRTIRGSNLDPPPPPRPRPLPRRPEPVAPEPPSKPIDWTSKENLIKAALLTGSAALAWRAAREMRP